MSAGPQGGAAAHNGAAPARVRLRLKRPGADTEKRWIAVPHGTGTVGDVIQIIAQACGVPKRRLRLSIEGYALPVGEPAALIREGDVLVGTVSEASTASSTRKRKSTTERRKAKRARNAAPPPPPPPPPASGQPPPDTESDADSSSSSSRSSTGSDNSAPRLSDAPATPEPHPEAAAATAAAAATPDALRQAQLLVQEKLRQLVGMGLIVGASGAPAAADAPRFAMSFSVTEVAFTPAEPSAVQRQFHDLTVAAYDPETTVVTLEDAAGVVTEASIRNMGQPSLVLAQPDAQPGSTAATPAAREVQQQQQQQDRHQGAHPTRQPKQQKQQKSRTPRRGEGGEAAPPAPLAPPSPAGGTPAAHTPGGCGAAAGAASPPGPPPPGPFGPVAATVVAWDFPSRSGVLRIAVDSLPPAIRQRVAAGAAAAAAAPPTPPGVQGEGGAEAADTHDPSLLRVTPDRITGGESLRARQGVEVWLRVGRQAGEGSPGGCGGGGGGGAPALALEVVEVRGGGVRPTPADPSDVDPTREFSGTASFWNATKNYGFIDTPDLPRSIFCKPSALQGGNVLTPGSAIRVWAETAPGGEGKIRATYAIGPAVAWRERGLAAAAATPTATAASPEPATAADSAAASQQHQQQQRSLHEGAAEYKVRVVNLRSWARPSALVSRISEAYDIPTSRLGFVRIDKASRSAVVPLAAREDYTRIGAEEIDFNTLIGEAGGSGGGGGRGGAATFEVTSLPAEISAGLVSSAVKHIFGIKSVGFVDVHREARVAVVPGVVLPAHTDAALRIRSAAWEDLQAAWNGERCLCCGQASHETAECGVASTPAALPRPDANADAAGCEGGGGGVSEMVQQQQQQQQQEGGEEEGGEEEEEDGQEGEGVGGMAGMVRRRLPGGVAPAARVLPRPAPPLPSVGYGCVGGWVG